LGQPCKPTNLTSFDRSLPNPQPSTPPQSTPLHHPALIRRRILVNYSRENCPPEAGRLRVGLSHRCPPGLLEIRATAMLSFMPRTTRDCQGVHRRHFLQVGVLGGLGLSLPAFLQAKAAAKEAGGRDVNCILIWTQGGTSHHDTFDPKPQAP